MSLCNLQELLALSDEKNWAIPHFNVHNPLLVRGVIKAAEEMNSPVILAVGLQSVKHAGLAPLAEYIKKCIEESDAKLALHYDHAKDLDILKQAIDLGFSSVMLDASSKPLEENIRLTNEVIKMARPKNISVEAEIGIVPAPGGQNTDICFTDPKQAQEFMDKTQVDMLAVSLGSIHGMTMASQSLNNQLLEELAPIAPLVLHGASGVTFEGIREVAEKGIRKININTGLKVTAANKLQEVFKENPKYDLLDAMDLATIAVSELAKKYIEFLNAANKA